MRSLGGRAEVEDPDDLEMWVRKHVHGKIFGDTAYNDHGKKDKAGTRGLQGALVTVDRVVRAQRSQDKATAQVSDDRDTVDIARVGTKGHDQTDDNAEHVTNGPPRVVGVVSLEVCNNR